MSGFRTLSSRMSNFRRCLGGSEPIARGAGFAAAVLATAIFATLAPGGLPAVAATAQDIGQTVGLTPAATGSVGGPLQVGGAVYRDETIRTGPNATAELQFLDNTHLGLVGSSSVKLDRFVYTGGGSAKTVVIGLSRGIFRFVTGSSPKPAYRIVTPLASIGVRGTVLNILSSSSRVTVSLLEGGADVCPNGARACVSLNAPGDTVTILRGGRVVPGGEPLDFAINCSQIGAGSELCSSDTVPDQPLFPSNPIDPGHSGHGGNSDGGNNGGGRGGGTNGGGRGGSSP